MGTRILVVEDDLGLARILRDNLSLCGFDVEWTSTVDDAMAAVRRATPELILLDIMLRGKTGFDVLGMLRQDHHVPVIILSARSQKADKLRGLGLGADDYVTKPFDLEELIGRVHAVLRRAKVEVERIELGTVTVDLRARTARARAREIHLTHREFEILACLATRRGQVVHRDELLQKVWGVSEGLITRSVDHAVGRLRKKLEADPHHPAFIHTVRGDGYYLALKSPSAETAGGQTAPRGPRR